MTYMLFVIAKVLKRPEILLLAHKSIQVNEIEMTKTNQQDGEGVNGIR